MELKELEYIVAIAEEGRISKAAERLYLAQSSLSQFLQRYEAELGTRLFIRTGSGVRPTPAGEIFIRNARQMLQQYQRTREELKDTGQAARGHIDLGLSSFRGSYLIPGVLEGFRRDYPGIEVHIAEHDSAVLLRKIAASELDMALVALRPGQKKPEDETVLRDEVCLVVNRAHPAMEYVHYGHRGRPWIELEKTGSFEYLLSNRSTVLGNVAEEQFALCGIDPPALNRDLTAAFAKAMACQGLGLAFTYASCVTERSDVEYVSLGREPYYVDLVLYFPPDGYRSRSLLALEKRIRDFYRDRNLSQHGQIRN